MIEYTKIMKFKYDGHYYQLLVDKNNKYFYLRINDDSSYSYISLKEFIVFNKIFCAKPVLSLNIVSDKKTDRKVKIVPKIIIGTLVSTLSISVLSAIYNEIEKQDINSQYYYIANDVLYSNISCVSEDGFLIPESDKIVANKYSDNVYIYDMAYLDDYFDYKDVTEEQMLTVVKKNKKINKQYKELFGEYVDALYRNMPNAEKRVLYENLKTLRVVECSKDELFAITMSYDSQACYMTEKNTIYVLKGAKFEKGTWNYQVLFHELSHALRNAKLKINKKNIRISSMSNSMNSIILDEALNSVFAVKLFNYEERDIAYQLQSNYISVILDCAKNYSIEDYANHSLIYLLKSLDEQNGDTDYAKIIFDLIELQYKDFHSTMIEVEQEEYYPIYDYISDMYFTKYITKDMSYSEAKAVADELVDRIMYDVPQEYNIDTNRFYECLDSYCQLVGIDISAKTR